MPNMNTDISRTISNSSFGMPRGRPIWPQAVQYIEPIGCRDSFGFCWVRPSRCSPQCLHLIASAWISSAQ